ADAGAGRGSPASRPGRSAPPASPGTEARARDSAPEPAPGPVFRTARPGARRRPAPFAHPAEQLPERGLAGQVTPQDQRVDEKSDQPFDLPPVAAGDGRAHGEILLP